MNRCDRRLPLCFLVFGMTGFDALAQTATYSLEAASINSARIPDGPMSEATVAPGDQLTIEIYLRDWSAKGEQLNAYQAQIDHMGYSSGPTGFIEPIGYSKKRDPQEDNHEHCFVDQNHPKFVHRGMQTVALTDSRSAGYRWLGVLLTDLGPKSDQQGEKFYVGSLILQVSDNASGDFKLDFVKEDSASGLRHADSTAISPLAFEHLTIHVDAGARTSRPPDAAADLDRLVEVLNGGSPTHPGGSPTHAIDGDLDGDGELGPTDMLLAIELLND